MAVITISRQYGSEGDDIARMLCDMLGYSAFNKSLKNRLGPKAGWIPDEIFDFSEEQNSLKRKRGVLDMDARLREIARMRGGAQSAERNEIVPMVEDAIVAAYESGSAVIVGRGSQAILRGKPGVLHVRVHAPLDMRIEWICMRQFVRPDQAETLIIERDRAAADYLKRFYGLDWADPQLYDIVINCRKSDMLEASDRIAAAVAAMQPQAVAA